jgi:biotin operon repressor
MPTRQILEEIKAGRQRYKMADTVVRLCEGFRADYMPSMKTWEAFVLLLILRKMLDQHVHGQPANASTLARSLGMPRTTVQRRLAQLKQIGAIKQHGSRFAVLSSYMNAPQMLLGFEHRRDMVRSASKKMDNPQS